MYFTQRTTSPKTGDPFWTSTAKGGKSPCYVINKSTGDTLPNCVGYAWGRCFEAWGVYPAWSPVNAENIINYKGGLKSGTTPKLGAIIVWRKGKAGVSSDGMGHVEFVEKVYDNGDVLTSASNYGGTRFYRSRRTKANNYSLGSAYTFQGFIYAPVELSETIGTLVERNTAVLQLEVKTDILNVRNAAGITAERLGYATKGIYNILSETKDGQYTWAEIENGLFVAEGEWLEVLQPTSELYNVTFKSVNDSGKDCLTNVGKELHFDYEVTAV